MSWADILEVIPDPEIVSDADGRARMISTGLPWRVRDRNTGIELLLVPPGEYLRGASDDDAECDVDFELPQHRVRVQQPLYLGKTEVTQAQWLWIMGDRPSANDAAGACAPVEMVAFERIREFLQQSELVLPRDAEWEYACRAGTTTPRYGDSDAIAWSLVNSGKRTNPVALKQANQWGFYDMLGNVWEFVGTKHTDYRQYSIEGVVPAEEDDEMHDKSTIYIIRGGPYLGGHSFMRASKRLGQHIHKPMNHIGFRVAKHVPAEVWSPEKKQ